MADLSTPIPHADQHPQRELDELRHNLLVLLIPICLIFAWVWLLATVIVRGSVGPELIAPTVAGVSIVVVNRLRTRAKSAALVVFLLGLVLSVALLVLYSSRPWTMTYGVVVIILAHAMVGAPLASLFTGLTWVAVSVAWLSKMGGIWAWDVIDVLALYGVVWFVGWVASRPQRISVQWALSAWQYASDALLETRERRAELYRTLRALEEATYRIERMNNELIVARGEAEQARAMKARFASMVSHELRNPLNLILGFSRLMARSPERYGALLPEPYRDDVEAIYRNSQHIVSLVDDILDLAQIEAQRMNLVKDQIDLEKDVVEKAADIIRPLAQRKGLFLRLDLCGELPLIIADAVRLRQALLNLLTNAVRLTEEGGILVRTAAGAGHVRVSVQDTGPGISPQDLPKLFREFSRLMASSSSGEDSADKGSGLGLSICKHLIELHGGRIEAHSEPGSGSTFTFTIPLPGASREGEPSANPSRSWRLPGRDCCLIVHDDPGIVRLLARYLDDYHVLGLPTEHEVLPLVRDLHPRAIITTPHMARAVSKELEDTIFDVPLVTCTMPRLNEYMPLGGVLGYLIKPISAEAVAAVMRQVHSDAVVTALLVDDDPDAVRLLEGLLMSIPHPYQILKAYDGAHALDLMQSGPPDIVLMDLLMPAMDGWEVLRQMRQDQRLASIPVVIVSAQDWTEEGACLGRTVQVRYRQAVTLDQGAQCLRGLIDALRPRYLEDPVVP